MSKRRTLFFATVFLAVSLATLSQASAANEHASVWRVQQELNSCNNTCTLVFDAVAYSSARGAPLLLSVASTELCLQLNSQDSASNYTSGGNWRIKTFITVDPGGSGVVVCDQQFWRVTFVEV